MKRRMGLLFAACLVTLLPVTLLLVACGAAAVARPVTPAETPDSATPPATGHSTSIPTIPHPVAGDMNCVLCHNPRSSVPIPANHAGYSIERCLDCHHTDITGTLLISQTTVDTTTLKLIPHPVADRKECSLCHGPDKLELPPDHAGLPDSRCLECHGALER